MRSSPAATASASCYRRGQVAHLRTRRRLLDGTTLVISPLVALKKDRVETSTRGSRARRVAQLDASAGAARGALRARSRRGSSSPCSCAPEQLGARGDVELLRQGERVAARGRRGALHLRVGLRLPSRLPAARRRRRAARPPDRARADGHRRRRRCATRSSSAWSMREPSVDRPRLRPPQHPAGGGPLHDERPEAARAARAAAQALRRPGIVYVASAQGREEVAAAIEERGRARRGYHAGLPARSATRRRRRFIADELDVIVGDHRVRHGNRQDERAVRDPLRAERLGRQRTPGDRPRGPRRGAGGGGADWTEDLGRAALRRWRQRGARSGNRRAWRRCATLDDHAGAASTAATSASSA